MISSSKINNLYLKEYDAIKRRQRKLRSYPPRVKKKLVRKKTKENTNHGRPKKTVSEHYLWYYKKIFIALTKIDFYF